jgi:hypothetical protein
MERKRKRSPMLSLPKNKKKFPQNRPKYLRAAISCIIIISIYVLPQLRASPCFWSVSINIRTNDMGIGNSTTLHNDPIV